MPSSEAGDQAQASPFDSQAEKRERDESE